MQTVVGFAPEERRNTKPAVGSEPGTNVNEKVCSPAPATGSPWVPVVIKWVRVAVLHGADPTFALKV